MHDALVNACAGVGVNCIVNTKVLIEHDARVGDNCHVSTASIVNGGTVFNKNILIGSNAIPITDRDDYGTLLERAYGGCAELQFDAIKQIQPGKVTRVPQKLIHPLGSFCSPRKIEGEQLDWNQDSNDVFNFVRAVANPGPQARTFLGDKEIMINRIRWMLEAPRYKGIPGAVIQKNSGGFTVKIRDSFVQVVEWSGDANIKAGDRLT